MGDQAVNIIHVIASPSPGGVETYVKDLAIQSVADSHVVHIGFLESANAAGTSKEFEKAYLNELELAGVKYFFVGRDARRWLWRGVAKMRKYVREYGIDVYHSHLTYGIIFGALVRVPRAYSHHSISMRVGRLSFALMNLLIEQLVGISHDCTGALSKHTGRKVVTITNGIDIKRITRRRLMARDIETDIACLSVGRICVEKNFGLLVEAISRLPDGIRSRLSVRIAGAGSPTMTALLQEEISRKGLEQVISLLGSRNDIPALLASSHIFLMSSSSEGLPISLIEATASGLPCVVTDAGGCREVIERCQNGVVVEVGNANALAGAIQNVIEDGERFARFSASALTHSNVFSIETAATSHIAMYRRLLSYSKKGLTSARDKVG